MQRVRAQVPGRAQREQDGRGEALYQLNQLKTNV